MTEAAAHARGRDRRRPMVDVSAKPVTAREATAAGRVLVSPEVVALLRGTGVPKGDAVAVARIAGIAGASGRRTSCRCATRSPCTGSPSTSR